MRLSFRSFAVSVLALSAALAARSASAGLVINPVFDPSITSDPNAAAIENSINSVIAFYESIYTDDITVKIYFTEGGGLGGSLFGYYYYGASTAIDALYADATTADDMIATSHLNTNGFGSIAFTTANGRALGYNTPGLLTVGSESDYDGVITLNASICFFDHHSPVGGRFDFFSACAHELDEVLGTFSGASNWLAYTADLYRYDGSGGRSFSGDPNAHAYFSIDGTTNIVEYNQFNHGSGDWGDWAPHNPSQTQDWIINSGISITPNTELRLLDVVGYNRVLQPFTYGITRGTYYSGTLANLAAVDGEPFVLKAGVTPFASDFPVQFVVTGTSAIHTPGSLKFRLTSKVQFANIGQTVEMFDFTQNAYVPVDYRIATTSYSSIEVSATDPARFVDPLTNHVQARIKFKGTQYLPINAWSVTLDQAVWDIRR